MNEQSLQLHSRLSDFSLEMVDLPPDFFQLSVIVRFQKIVTVVLQFANLCLDLFFVYPDDVVMLVCIDTEGLAQGRKQLIFMHGLVAMQRFVFLFFRNFAELRDGHFLQFFVRIFHFIPSSVCRSLLQTGMYGFNHFGKRLCADSSYEFRCSALPSQA
jgi:hypothetical protein